MADSSTAALTIRNAKIFQVGDYPDKNFSLTLAEAQEAAKSFIPVPVDLEHMPTVLSGKLGHLERLEVGDDGQIFGSVSLPTWLNDALGDAMCNVSATWDRATKKLKGIALVTNPRISDAALMSAFVATFEGRRNSEADLRSLQAAHDHLHALGAECPPPAATTTTDSNSTPITADRLAKLKSATQAGRAKVATQRPAWDVELIPSDRIKKLAAHTQTGQRRRSNS